MKLSKRIANIPESPTLAINARVKKMKGVINLSVGEPDFDTPENIKEAARKAIGEGFTKYTPTAGIDELKEAIASRFKQSYSLEYEEEEILVSCGAKHSLYNLAQVLFDKGDEVIISAPYWVSYPPIVKLSGAKPVIWDGLLGGKPNFNKLAKLITPKTRAIILNFPNNPSGMVLEKEDLEKIAEICISRKIWIISDEIYEKIVYDGFKHICVASLSNKAKERTIVISGVSKTYAMTGWRIGYAAGPKEIISAMTRLQDQMTSNPNSIAQKAAVEALIGPQDSVEIMRKEFEKRRNLILELLKSIKVKQISPKGAFYVFPDFSYYLNKELKNSLALTNYLLDEAKVAVVPGSAFGKEGYLRISFAASEENIGKGIQGIKMALEKLS